MSVLATTTRAEDFPESFAGESSLGVDGWAIARVSLTAFGAGLAGGFVASLVCAASPESVPEGGRVAIAIPSGPSEAAARTVLGSGNCDAVGGGAAGGGAATGVLTVATAGVPPDTPTGGCAAPTAAGPKAPDGDALSSGACARSIGCSSELTTLTWAGCVLSFRRVAGE